MKKLSLAAILAVTLAAGVARADISYQPNVFNAKNAGGNLLTNGTYLLVIDLNGDGLSGTPYATQPGAALNTASSWQWDANDLVIDRGGIGSVGVGSGDPFDDGVCYPNAYLSTSSIPAAYTPNVDHYYLLWFDVAYGGSAVQPGAGVHYGVFDMGTVVADPNVGVTPDVDLGSFTTNLTTTSAAPVPEPATLSLLALGGLAAIARRIARRRAA